MSDSRTFLVRGTETRASLLEVIRRLPVRAGIAYRVTIEPDVDPHTSGQRKLVHALCGEIADAGVTFPGGGWASARAWYGFLLGLHRGETMIREGNVVVVLGGGLSGATKTEASEIIEFIRAYGTEKGVQFSADKRHEETSA